MDNFDKPVVCGNNALDSCSPRSSLVDAHEGPSENLLSQRFSKCSLVLGVAVGILMEFSTVGVNQLSLAKEEEEDEAVSVFAAIGLPCFFSLLILILALAILSLMRQLLVTVHHLALTIPQRCLSCGKTNIAPNNEGADQLLQRIVQQMETRFVMGAFAGICLSWTGTDLFLGIDRQMAITLFPLTATLLTYYLFGCARKRTVHRNDVGHESRCDFVQLALSDE